MKISVMYPEIIELIEFYLSCALPRSIFCDRWQISGNNLFGFLDYSVVERLNWSRIHWKKRGKCIDLSG